MSSGRWVDSFAAWVDRRTSASFCERFDAPYIHKVSIFETGPFKYAMEESSSLGRT
jgi:hypothetical protein